MKLIKAVINFLLKIMPYKLLIKIYPYLKKTILRDIIDTIYYERFFRESELVNDFDNYIGKIEKSKKYCIINQGEWAYRICNFCFVKDMISLMIWCMESGYKPIINILPSSDYYEEKSNLWEMFFEQPFGKGADEIGTEKCRVCPIPTYAVKIGMYDVLDDKKFSIWNKIIGRLVIPNSKTQGYFDEEYNRILKGKRTVGCVVRGTDYTKLKPKGHPKQPEIDELKDKLKSYIDTGKYEYIYLATEEKKISDMIKDAFPGVVLENKRQYFDEQYFGNKDSDMVSKVHFDRENDDYLKMLEYMSSINLVSKCNALVTGLCGGSEMAVYWNSAKYEDKYVFDKGKY